MAFGCVNLPIAQWLYQSCVAQMWSRRAELIPSKVWRRADHMYLSSLMASGMKNKILIADPPPAISWHVERDRRREEEKNNRKKWKCFCPRSDSIKELSEQRIHNTRVRERFTKCAHVRTQAHTRILYGHAHARAHGYPCSKTPCRQWNGGCFRLTEDCKKMSNCCWRWVSSRQG